MRSFITVLLMLVGILIGFIAGESSDFKKEVISSKVNKSINNVKEIFETQVGKLRNAYEANYRETNNNESISVSNVTDASIINAATRRDTEPVQKTHGSFSNNTNACSGCHLTHNGTGDGILIQKTTGETCMACHDGSLGFYDVMSGKIFIDGPVFIVNDRKILIDHDSNISTPPKESTLSTEVSKGFRVGSTAGVFSNSGNSDDLEKSKSMHNAIGGLIKIKAAPGGNRQGQGDINWEDVFDCASCHEPHGSYSDRLLHRNPNGMATISYLSKGNAVGEGGLIYRDSNADPKVEDANKTKEFFKKQILVSNGVPNTNTDKFILVRDTANNHLKNMVNAKIRDRKNKFITMDTPYFRVNNFGEEPSLIQGKIIMVYKWNSAKNAYQPDITPWVSKSIDPLTEASSSVTFGIDQSKAINEKVSNGKDGNLYFDYTKAFAYSGPGSTKEGDQVFGIDNIKWGHVGRAYIVKLDKIKVATYSPSGTELYVTSNGALVGGDLEVDGTLKNKWGLTTSSGLGEAMSNFCTACHVDYLSKGNVKEGTYSTSYRHKSDSDATSCVRCHYSHGTNQEIMRDASEKNYEQLKKLGQEHTLVDDNQSSALKRYVNMSACWGCHSSPDYIDISTGNSDVEDNNRIKGLNLQGTWTSGNRWGLQR